MKIIIKKIAFGKKMYESKRKVNVFAAALGLI